jgi:ribose transport system permease protein
VSRLLHKYWPSHLFGEILSRQWVDTAIPFVFLSITLAWLSSSVPGYFSPVSTGDVAAQYSEFAFVVLGLAIVMIVGGIDLSVGSIVALGNFVALYAINILGVGVGTAAFLTVTTGLVLGTFNGFLIGYLRMRAFITTLITLIIFRAVYELLLQSWAVSMSAVFVDNDLWYALTETRILLLPPVFYLFLILAASMHIFLTRMRGGWHIRAIGGARRTAVNSGLPVKRAVFLCYVASGMLSALAGFFLASRLSAASADIGLGWEFRAITAAVVGGITLGGGQGSVARALIGSMIVLFVNDAMVRLGYSGGSTRIAMAVILISAALFDVRWKRNRERIAAGIYVSPTYLDLPEAPTAAPGSGSPYEVNDRLLGAIAIGLGEIEGPEDVILDSNDNLYSGSRHGEIIRFFAPDYKKHEVFAQIGGHTLGMAFDPENNLYVCVSGMGLYCVSPEGIVSVATDQTNRSLFSVVDDSRLRLADDCDIAPDGKVYFSEATVRYEAQEWPVDSLEGRGNGRIICYDPATNSTRTVLKNLIFPNGMAVSHDGKSILFSQTWACSISRFWLEGPKKGSYEVLVPDLPGYPDNINRASDGGYWIAIVGMRYPAFDLAMVVPSFRKAMTRQLPPDEWLYPNLNYGCVAKINEAGDVVDVLWDPEGENHPMITSMREHKGKLFLGGIFNNRIGMVKLQGQDETYIHQQAFWSRFSGGKK